MRGTILCSALPFLLALPALELQADSLSQPAGVTLELCGDVKAEEVQAALAIEYQEEEFGNTMLTVRCRGEFATLRIIGPNHPKGRIADIDLQGVEAVAKSRTIAVLAAELWTAPEALEPLEAPGEKSVVAASASNPVAEAVTSAKTRTRPANARRNQLSVGVGLVQSRRAVSAARWNNSYQASGDFYSLAFQADWPVFRWLGLFTQASVSSSTHMAGHAELNAPVRWRRSETGAYIPLWRKRFRADVRGSFGTDTITAQGVYVRNSERTLLPRYHFYSIGVDLAYQVSEKTNVLAWGATYSAETTDFDYSQLSGSLWGLGVYYQVRPTMRLEAKAEVGELLEGSTFTMDAYQDRSSSLSVLLNYTR